MKSFRHYLDQVEIEKWDDQHESDYRVIVRNFDRRAYLDARIAMMFADTDNALMLARSFGIR
jgi:hypothetical protein